MASSGELYAVKAGVVCLQVKLCDPHLSALEVRFSRRGAIQIYVYLTFTFIQNLPLQIMSYTFIRNSFSYYLMPKMPYDGKVEKMILDSDPDLDPDQSKIHSNVPYLKAYFQNIHEHSSTIFWVIPFQIPACGRKFEKSILDRGPDPDLTQTLSDWFLAEGLSFHEIWFKSVNNFLRYRYPTDRHTHRQRQSATWPSHVILGHMEAWECFNLLISRQSWRYIVCTHGHAPADKNANEHAVAVWSDTMTFTNSLGYLMLSVACIQMILWLS